ALILFLTGLKLLYDKFNEPVGFQSPLLILLSYKQKNIVWVYSIIKENMPFGVKLLGSGRIMFRTLDKKEFSISVSENEILLLSKELESHLPQATFGYSSEKDNLYEINPYLLLDSDGKE
ncbi:MAG: hypothetical protein ACPG5P_03885, partial [Saprospiraceae bacterium]